MNEREDIFSSKLMKSLQYVEGWATVKWHRIHGGIGIPGGESCDQSSSFRRGTPSNMPGLFDAFIIVEESLNQLKKPWILIAFFLWCYPKTGTYERNGDYQNFRPRELTQMAKDFCWDEEQITDSLKKMEYQFLLMLCKKL